MSVVTLKVEHRNLYNEQNLFYHTTEQNFDSTFLIIMNRFLY